jgi:D-alanyl-D-alanine carboxypeptidase
MLSLKMLRKRFGVRSIGFFICWLWLMQTAFATPYVVVDAVSGEVIYAQDATRPWYPASLTKLMTLYVTFKAIKMGRVELDTPFVMSRRAAHMPPSKMGFNPGTEVTLDNALKMMMVKSANDIAVMIAEGVAGSVEKFAAEMNQTAAQLGMNSSHFVNPNGLHDPRHYSSARDLAIIARALLRDFPQYNDLYQIGALQLGESIIPTHNGLLGRYRGADGMKTGFTCPAGFNVVASATQNNHRLIAVVLGYPNAKLRTFKVASLLDNAFQAQPMGLKLSQLRAESGEPVNMREDICGKNRKKIIEEDFGAASPQGSNEDIGTFLAGHNDMTSSLDLTHKPLFDPLPVFIGRRANWMGPVAQADHDDYVAKTKTSAHHRHKDQKNKMPAQESSAQ